MSRSKLVVFFIDHDEAARVTHETILRSEGYEILSAADGTRALELLREQVADLLIIGHKLGSMTPTQLIRMVKTDVTLSTVPILVCVPDTHAALHEDVLRAGAEAVISDTTSPRELMRNVIHLIGRP